MKLIWISQFGFHMVLKLTGPQSVVAICVQSIKAEKLCLPCKNKPWEEINYRNFWYADKFLINGILFSIGDVNKMVMFKYSIHNSYLNLQNYTLPLPLVIEQCTSQIRPTETYVIYPNILEWNWIEVELISSIDQSVECSMISSDESDFIPNISSVFCENALSPNFAVLT